MKLELHCSESHVYYWRRDTRTVKGAFSKTSRPISSKLKYYSVRYACVFGGEKKKSRSQGKRHNNKSVRNDCPSFIMLRASKDGVNLEVVGVNNDHNHDCNENVNQNLPHHRKLPEDVKQEVVEMMLLHIDRPSTEEYEISVTTDDGSKEWVTVCNSENVIEYDVSSDYQDDPNVEVDVEVHSEDLLEYTEDPTHFEGLHYYQIIEEAGSESDFTSSEIVAGDIDEHGGITSQQTPHEQTESRSENLRALRLKYYIKRENNQLKKKKHRGCICGFLRMQVKSLKAEKGNLLKETNILRLTIQKLTNQIMSIDPSLLVQ
ncbi:hypothetical protein Bhyg_02421 [Pseudolycoriella hygida]|uniref:ZSWIM3 N-terminal domain-containing protein n=1 Tax=Pseudolycoriella hygida TaxID=35572 RepID=A0A9Q0NBC7_9DIPT|nr:hypothetical protein Bhyg_02421 [Pseudolycoriella hygida]